MNILGNALAKGKRKTLREALEDRGGFECTRCGHKGHYGKCDKCECDRQVRKQSCEIRAETRENYAKTAIFCTKTREV